MKLHRTALLMTCCTLLLACGGGLGAETRDAIPELKDLTLEVTGHTSEGVPAAAGEGLELPGPQAVNVPQYLGYARDGVRSVNATITDLMGRVRQLLEGQEGRQTSGGGRVYGPKDVGNVTYRLLARKLGDDAYGWRLEAKPLGAEDSRYLRVMGGGVRKRPDGARRGIFGANLDNMKLADPSHPGQGVLMAAFGLRGEGKTLVYRLQRFTPDAQQHPPVTAAFIGHRRTDTGATAVKLAIHRNLPQIPGGTDAAELVRLRARWLPGSGGRATVLATAGDIPQGQAYVGMSCWNAQLEEGFKRLLHCTAVGTPSRSCTVVQTAGDPASCRAQVRDPSEPALDPMDGALDEDAPDTGLTAPGAEPTGDSAG